MSSTSQFSARRSANKPQSCAVYQTRCSRVRVTRREAWRLVVGLVPVLMSLGCSPLYSERVWDTGLRPIIQVIPESDWEREVPMCPTCFAVTTKYPQHTYVIKLRGEQSEVLEHEFQHIWEWETNGTTDHILVPGERPDSPNFSASMK